MESKHTILAGIVLALSLGAASAVLAHPGDGAHGEGRHGHAGAHHGTTEHGVQRGSAHDQDRPRGHGSQLMTPEERRAFGEKMHNAMPEERAKMMQAMREEMHKRAQEHGVRQPAD